MFGAAGVVDAGGGLSYQGLKFPCSFQYFRYFTRIIKLGVSKSLGRTDADDCVS